MLKLKQLQQQKTDGDKPAEQPAAAAPAAAGTEAAPASGDGFVLKKSTSKEMAEARAKKTAQGVLSLKRAGAKKAGGGKKQNPAELRAQKDISEMDLEATPGVKVDFPDPNNLMKFYVNIKPNDGLYKAAEFKFTVEVPLNYPYDPPKATCETMVYHPNIDWEGHVCLNILRADWKPVLTLSSVLFGLMTLFLEPNPDDPLNKEAAELMINKRADFEANVKKSLRGGSIAGRSFPALLK